MLAKGRMLFLVLLAAVALAGPTALLGQAPAKVEGQPASALPNVNTLTEGERAAGWNLLFDGKTTAGCRNFRKEAVSPAWQVIDGALCRVAKSAGDLITVGQYEIGAEDWNRRVAASKFAKYPKGHIARQGDHGDACYTNIKLLSSPAGSR